MIRQDISENQVSSVYLAIGSNLGNRLHNIEKAKLLLSQKGIAILKSSSYYESLSWPNEKYPKYINVVLKVLTNLKPKELLKVNIKIENLLGRKRSTKNSPRTCDIDIIDYEDTLLTDDLILPHPRMHKRSFVLLPLFEINKAWKHPITKQNIRTLIYLLSKKDITSIKIV